MRQGETVSQQTTEVNTPKAKSQKAKLGYKEQKELAALPRTIEQLENEKAQLEQDMAQPEFYQRAKDDITQTLKRLETVTGELEHAYSRWEYLEACLSP